jgi:hypothetical protein
MTKIRNLVTGLNDFLPYHDDMYDANVKILAFPFSDLFGDFRLFNGITIENMDAYIGAIREIMIDIANDQAMLAREEELRKKAKP